MTDLDSVEFAPQIEEADHHILVASAAWVCGGVVPHHELRQTRKNVPQRIEQNAIVAIERP
jgi:hypothetical protein